MVDDNLKDSTWGQFGAAIEYLEDAIRACPDELWRASLWLTPDTKREYSEFWYVAYHTLFWLHLYLTGTEDGFVPPAPFSLIEQDENGPLPERAYTKDELLTYLDEGRRACMATIYGLTEERAQQNCWFGWGEVTFLGLLYYNMRHVQSHAAQLSMLLGQIVGPQRDYVTLMHRPTA